MLTFTSFLSFLNQDLAEMRKKYEFSWSAQHPNAGQNIQQWLDVKAVLKIASCN